MRPESADRPLDFEPTTITVAFDETGFHRWEGATGTREYLASRHRHRFNVSVSISVHHDDREVEFHDLLDLVRGWWPGPELGGKSCEDIARTYVLNLADRFPRREYSCSVWEDGEVGATISARDR